MLPVNHTTNTALLLIVHHAWHAHQLVLTKSAPLYFNVVRVSPSLWFKVWLCVEPDAGIIKTLFSWRLYVIVRQVNVLQNCMQQKLHAVLVFVLWLFCVTEDNIISVTLKSELHCVLKDITGLRADHWLFLLNVCLVYMFVASYTGPETAWTVCGLCFKWIEGLALSIAAGEGKLCKTFKHIHIS